jgi:hypothetical protein
MVVPLDKVVIGVAPGPSTVPMLGVPVLSEPAGAGVAAYISARLQVDGIRKVQRWSGLTCY